MQEDIFNYHNKLPNCDKEICDKLFEIIQSSNLKNVESKIWHAHPVWFNDGNPLFGYHKLKDSVRLLFWSGQSFNEPNLATEGKFKAAEIRYTNVNHIKSFEVKRWLKKSITIQWDYKNIVKRKGVLIKLTKF